MIKWKDLVDALGTDSEPPFSLDSEKELRKWCAEHFGVTYTAVHAIQQDLGSLFSGVVTVAEAVERVGVDAVRALQLAALVVGIQLEVHKAHDDVVGLLDQRLDLAGSLSGSLAGGGRNHAALGAHDGGALFLISSVVIEGSGIRSTVMTS